MSSHPLDQRLARLMSRIGSGARLGLRGVRQALEMLGAPQRDLKAVHVAGTNGKGSVCAMVEATARAAGLRTGLYTSPHLCRFNERIRIDGQPIGDAAFCRALDQALDPQLPELTFFETMTVAGLVAMSEANVDLAVLEVGLGGRLDATNVIDAPLATAITSIGVDHARVLGDDLATIGAEKAGILKPACPTVVGPVPAAVWRAIHRVARRIGAHPIWRVAPPPHELRGRRTPALHARLQPSGQLIVDGPGGQRAAIRLGLAGPHQADNAAVALGVIWLLEAVWPAMTERASQALAAVRWPGRLEPIPRGEALVLLDGAHNPAAAVALVHALRGRVDPARTTLIFGAMSDKSWEPMIALLAPLATRRFFTEPLRPIAGRRSADPRAIAARIPGQWIGDPRATIAHALAQALPGETIVVTGSIFLVGAVRAFLLGLREDDVLPL